MDIFNIYPLRLMPSSHKVFPSVCRLEIVN